MTGTPVGGGQEGLTAGVELGCLTQMPGGKPQLLSPPSAMGPHLPPGQHCYCDSDAGGVRGEDGAESLGAGLCHCVQPHSLHRHLH